MSLRKFVVCMVTDVFVTCISTRRIIFIAVWRQRWVPLAWGRPFRIDYRHFDSTSRVFTGVTWSKFYQEAHLVELVSTPSVVIYANVSKVNTETSASWSTCHAQAFYFDRVRTRKARVAPLWTPPHWPVWVLDYPVSPLLLWFDFSREHYCDFTFKPLPNLSAFYSEKYLLHFTDFS